MDKRYNIILKTGEAEIRAIENTKKEILEKVFPIIEITRGRRITKDKVEIYPFEKRLSKLKKAFSEQIVCFDLTSEEALFCEEIEKLYNPKNGYENWIKFLLEIKEENIFTDIVPTVILNVDDEDFETNLELQIKGLKQNFSSILYRNPITDENCYDDLKLINKICKDQIKLYIVIDCEYTPQSTHRSFAEKSIVRIKNIHSILGDNPNYILCGTSFPNNISEFGDVNSATFNISEITIHELVTTEIPFVLYGDYGSINPVRNDTVTMARGWIPRIDTPLENTIYYYKQRRPKGVSAYASTYNHVAQLVVRDDRFPKHLIKNWGIKQTQNCSEGGAPSSSPSFWISVRMNVHIEQQVRRLYSITED